MSRTLDILREDHRNFWRILDLLEEEIEAFQRAERPDYGLIQAIASYFREYPDTTHHPVEDVIMGRLARRDAEAAAAVGDLERDHCNEKERLDNFVSILNDILHDQEIPRDALVSSASSFITHLRRHIQMEEDRFFTAAERHLLPEDWAELDTQLTEEVDPVFRGAYVAQFHSLRDQILTWARSHARVR